MPRVSLRNIQCWMSTQVFPNFCLSLGTCNKILISSGCVVAFEGTTPQSLLPKMGETETWKEGKRCGPFKCLAVASACRGGYCNLGLQQVCDHCATVPLPLSVSISVISIMILNHNSEPSVGYSLGLACEPLCSHPPLSQNIQNGREKEKEEGGNRGGLVCTEQTLVSYCKSWLFLQEQEARCFPKGTAEVGMSYELKWTKNTCNQSRPDFLWKL